MKTLLRIPMLLLLSLIYFQCDMTREIDDAISGNEVYMRFKVNGVQKEYKGEDAVVVYFESNDEEEDVFTIWLAGGRSDQEDTDLISLIAIDVQPNLVQYIYPNSSEDETSLFLYNDEADVSHVGGHLADDLYEIQTTIFLKITSKANEYWEGEFSAKLFNTETETYTTISDGKFKALYSGEDD